MRGHSLEKLRKKKRKNAKLGLHKSNIERGKNRDNLWEDIWENNFDDIIITAKNRISTAFDDKATLLNYFPITKLATRNKLKFKKSLEIGCGSGTYSLILKKIGATSDVFLIDLSLQSLYGAKTVFDLYGEKCYPLLADAKSLPFKDKVFDISISGGVVEHFKDEEQQKMVREHCRCSENVLCQVPLNSLSYWIYRIVFTLLNSFKWPFGYEKPLSLGNLKKLFSNEGFSIKDVSYHDVLTAVLFVKFTFFYKKLPTKIKFLLPNIFRKEVVVYAINKTNKL
jgi:SAM-dependent methyltransferase